MRSPPRKIDLTAWDSRYAALSGDGPYGPNDRGPLRRHVECRGDRRLRQLLFDDSPAALRLWHLLLSEEDRLRAHRGEGRRLVGAMKDLGTVPVMAYALPNLVSFYPDGAWWTPCLMEHADGLLRLADRLGIDDSFCPVRAMLGAFQNEAHFPRPDLLICSVGAVCDDFSAVAQRLESMGFPMVWWELPRRRPPDPGEEGVDLPGGAVAAARQVREVHDELERIGRVLGSLAGCALDEPRLAAGVRQANAVRRRLRALRRTVFTASACPLPALEMLIAEMLAIHYCSDPRETVAVLDGLLDEANARVAAREGVLGPEAVRVFWVNPVADLRAMNLLEDCGGRVCGTDYLFGHALVDIPETLPPMEALARVALADPMIGPTQDRARSIARDLRRFQAEALIVSRIPGASHCAREGGIIQDYVAAHCGVPTLEIEVPPVLDAVASPLRSRLEALIETVRSRRTQA